MPRNQPVARGETPLGGFGGQCRTGPAVFPPRDEALNKLLLWRSSPVAFLVLLSAAAGTGIVAAHILVRVRRGLGSAGAVASRHLQSREFLLFFPLEVARQIED